MLSQITDTSPIDPLLIRDMGRQYDIAEVYETSKIEYLAKAWFVCSIVLVLLGVSAQWVLGTTVGASMDPTVYAGQTTLRIPASLAYAFTDVKRGDIVVVSAPVNEKKWVKRVIATAGETISFDAGSVLINRVPIFEPYLAPENSTYQSSIPDDFMPNFIAGCVGFVSASVDCKVAPGYVYLLGDNRDISFDSRTVGPVSEKSIKSKIVAKVWPLGSFQIF